MAFFGFLLFYLVYLSFCSNDELKAVVVVYRHGDRTPTHPTYPNDPYKDDSNWPEGFGQLVERGIRREYELGQFLRQRYDNFLSKNYTSKELYVRSTDFDRTLMSAYATLAGLYPVNPASILKFQPIPVHSQLFNDDILLMHRKCKRHKKLKKIAYHTTFDQFDRNHSDLYKYLTDKSGMKVENLKQVAHIYSTLFVEKDLNRTLPKWSESVFPEKLKIFDSLKFSLNCLTNELTRLRTGPFFYRLIEFFVEKLNNQPKVKFLMYSAHDTTVANLLMALNAYNYKSPPYGSILIFELRQKGTSHFVNIFYRTDKNLQPIILKNCQFHCDFYDFTQYLLPIVLSEQKWDEECQNF